MVELEEPTEALTTGDGTVTRLVDSVDRAVVEGLMATLVVVMLGVFGEDAVQMPFPEDDQSVKAFRPN